MRAADARAVQLAAERAAHGAGKPLVEIADHHARAGEIVVEDLLANERRHLVGALADLEAEVHVEEVEQTAAHDGVEADAPARLAGRPAQVELVGAVDGKRVKTALP
mgnify:CR=1 FL=1